jgi:N6-L-threonylcarbamoyladenine synthase
MTTVLAIETSCDETAVALVRDRQILTNVVSSQVATHANYGGVVPEVAARQHLELINQTLDRAMEGHSWSEVDGIAVTCAPGLIGALIIGTACAKTLALVHHKPLIAIHHLEGHICSAFLADPQLQPPFLCLLVSGGHTSLVVVKDYGNYTIVGQTRDDAAGEAFDKVARLLNLGYPGGPAIDRLAQQGNPTAFNLPQGKIASAPYDFSFSGLKTAVLRLTEKTTYNPADLAASFQATVSQTLVDRTIKCALDYQLHTIVAVGGVAANSGLRAQLLTRACAHQLQVFFPPLNLCTDNAAMIGCAGVIHLDRGETSSLLVSPQARLSLEEHHTLYT